MLFSPGYPGIPPRPGAGGRRRVRGDHIRRPGRPLPARRRTKPTISQTDSTSSTVSRSARAAWSCSPSSAPAESTRCGRATSRRWPPACSDPVGVAFDQDGAPLVAESGAGRVVQADRLRLRGRGRRIAAAAGHPGARRTALHRRRRRQGGHRVRPGQQGAQHHRLGAAGRRAARSRAQAAARACRRSPARRARSPASRRDPMARCTFRPTGTAACWRCVPVPEWLHR